MNERDQVIAYLREQPMLHLVHLKFLGLYRDRVDYAYRQTDDGAGVMILYPPPAILWDAQTYKRAHAVIMPTANTPNAARELLSSVQELFEVGSPLIFKFCDAMTREVFQSAYIMKPARTFTSYTNAADEAYVPDPTVVISEGVREDCAPFFLANGYDEDELARIHEDGAFTCHVEQDDAPVSACLCFKNYARYWEIGGVHTREDARGQGYARRVVTTALHTLITNGMTARYQTDAANAASVGLAKALGLRAFLSFEHWRTSK
jgi:GNAT superfamily N-acetyltransferase